jgi:excisionase family DNA binding protein
MDSPTNGERDTIFSVASLAKYLSVSDDTIYRALQRREFPFLTVGDSIRISRKVIDSILRGEREAKR